MPMYFFHIRDGWERILDDEGMEFPNLDRAEVEAHASARDLASSAPFERRIFAAYAVEVADEDGNVLSRIKVEPIYRVAQPMGYSGSMLFANPTQALVAGNKITKPSSRAHWALWKWASVR